MQKKRNHKAFKIRQCIEAALVDEDSFLYSTGGDHFVHPFVFKGDMIADSLLWIAVPQRLGHKVILILGPENRWGYVSYRHLFPRVSRLPCEVGHTPMSATNFPAKASVRIITFFYKIKKVFHRVFLRVFHHSVPHALQELDVQLVRIYSKKRVCYTT